MFTPPIPPRDVARLVELFEGELRAVLEILGQTFMEELGPVAKPRTITADEVIQIQRPILTDLLPTLSAPQRRVLGAVARLTEEKDRVRQKDLVSDLGKGFSQGYVSQIAEALADGKWIAKHNPNQRTTFYSLGGRAKIIGKRLAEDED